MGDERIAELEIENARLRENIAKRRTVDALTIADAWAWRCQEMRRRVRVIEKELDSLRARLPRDDKCVSELFANAEAAIQQFQDCADEIQWKQGDTRPSAAVGATTSGEAG